MDVTKIVANLDEMQDFINTEIHPLISPDHYNTYCQMIDLIDVMRSHVDEIQKAQEPRVISYDEIENYEVLWLEVLDVNTEDGLAPWVKTKSGHWFSPLLCSDAQPEMILATSDEYGKICRCWTSRPTDKQRKEVKWNG